MSLPAGFGLSFDYTGPSSFREQAAELASRLATALALPPPNAVEFDPTGRSATLRLAPDRLLSATHPAPDFWRADLETFLGSLSDGDSGRRLLALRNLAVEELRAASFEKAELFRIGSDADGFPQVPLLRKRHLFATKAKLEDYYEDVAACHACPGVHIETIGDYLLVIRALDAISDEDFLRASLQQCWHFARAAKPGVVTYGELPHEKHRDIYQAAPARLQPVGYADASAEYACYLEPDEHIAGWEIDGLQRMLKEGQFSDGRPLRAVRVAFPNRAQAAREKRPLLDCGVKVVFLERGSEHEFSV